MTSKKPRREKQITINELIRIFIDGAGQRPDGTGSGFAWLRESDGENFVHREERLTNNQAEYKALISALRELAPNSIVEVLTDSLIVAAQFQGRFKVRSPALRCLLNEAKVLIEERELNVTVSWISREQNRAGSLL